MMSKNKFKYTYGFRRDVSFYVFVFLVLFVYPIIIFLLPEIKDYQNYLGHVENADVLLANFAVLVASGSPSAIFAEPLWPVILTILNLFLGAEIVMGLIIGLSATLISLGIAKINKRPWVTLVLVFVLYPLATMYFMQLRQGFAMALYFWVYSSDYSFKKSWFFKLLTPLIHTSVFLLIPVEIVYNLMRSLKFSKRLLIAFSSFCAIGIVLLIPTLVNFAEAQNLISTAFELEAPEISGLGTLAWSSYATAFFLLNRPTKEMAIGLVGILVYIFSQFYIDIGGRLLQMFLPFVIASFSYRKKKMQILIAMTIAFGLILWIPTLMSPGRVFSGG